MCLWPHRVSQRGAGNERADTGVVVDVAGDHQGTARLTAFDDKGVQTSPSRVDRCGISGWARPDDDDIANPVGIGHQSAARRWRDRGATPSARRITVAVWADSRASWGKAYLPSVLSEVDAWPVRAWMHSCSSSSS